MKIDTMKTLEHKEFSVKVVEDLEDRIFGKSNDITLNDDNDKRKEIIAVLNSKHVRKGINCIIPKFSQISIYFIWHCELT